jgi:hypothetical protein
MRSAHTISRTTFAAHAGERENQLQNSRATGPAEPWDVRLWVVSVDSPVSAICLVSGNVGPMSIARFRSLLVTDGEVAPAWSQHAGAICRPFKRGRSKPRGRQLDQPYGKHFAKRSRRSV